MKRLKKDEKHKKHKVIIGVSSLIIILGLSSFFGYLYSNTRKWTGLIFPGVKVQGENLGGKTKEEARKLIQEKYGDKILKKNLCVKSNGKNYKIDYSKLNAKYNIDEVINEAFSYGKNVNLLKKYKLIKSPKDKPLNLKFSYDAKPVKETVKQVEKDINKQPVNGELKFANGKFQVIPDKLGAKLQSEKLEKDILNKINGNISEEMVIEAPVEQIKAQITAEMLANVNTKLSTFSTSYTTSDYARSTNIELATKAIDGTVIIPGGTFSFNGIVGKRTPQKGYKSAPVIVGNKVQDDFGGGICQVSTTLYNAVLKSNIKASERSHHTLPSHYIGLGMDATIDYGNIDYKFVNTLKYPIYIEAYTKNKIVTFNVYSSSTLASRTYDIVNEVYETLQPKVKYIDDPTMPEGETKEEQAAFVGHRVKVYKNAYENGKLIEHELISNDTYLSVDRVIRRGIKKTT